MYHIHQVSSHRLPLNPSPGKSGPYTSPSLRTPPSLWPSPLLTLLLHTLLLCSLHTSGVPASRPSLRCPSQVHTSPGHQTARSLTSMSPLRCPFLTGMRPSDHIKELYQSSPATPGPESPASDHVSCFSRALVISHILTNFMSLCLSTLTQCQFHSTESSSPFAPCWSPKPRKVSGT